MKESVFKHKRESPSIARIAAGYLLASTSASLAFALFLIISATILASGPEKITLDSILIVAHLLSFMTLLIFFIGLLSTLATTFVPFTIAIVVARHLRITHWFYFVAGAAVTAASIAPLYITLCNRVSSQEIVPSVAAQLWLWLPVFIICGSVAGVVYSCWIRPGPADSKPDA